MKKLYYDQDANWDLMLDRKVAVIGYGSQGHAHSLNLKESGVDVTVGLYKGSKSWAKAEAAGLKVATVAEATAQADVVMILIPDEKQAATFREHIAPNLKPGAALAFLRGMRFGVETNWLEFIHSVPLSIADEPFSTPWPVSARSSL